MNALKKSLLSIGAALAALTLVAGPVTAAESTDVVSENVAEEGAETGTEPAEDGKLQLAETPRDQFGLLLLGALVLGGALALGNARRQLKGERPQASGEFRWR